MSASVPYLIAALIVAVLFGGQIRSFVRRAIMKKNPYAAGDKVRVIQKDGSLEVAGFNDKPKVREVIATHGHVVLTYDDEMKRFGCAYQHFGVHELVRA